MNLSNTHLLDEVLPNVTGSPLKDQRLSDIQNVADDKYSHVNGNESTEAPEKPKTEETNEPKTETVDNTDEQAKDVAAKEHAKQEPAKIFGVKVVYIVGGLAVIGGGYWAYTKYFKK